MAFLLVKTENSEGMKKADIGRSRESVNSHSITEVLDARESIQEASCRNEKGRETCAFHWSMRMVLNDLESTCTAGSRAISKRITEVSWFLILTSNYCDNHRGRDIFWI